jgi:formylglycine-generating enzyme
MPPRMVLPPQFPERFATEWGRDEYGIFQSFAIKDVVQRMRWIPPGSFLMGSPRGELLRLRNEYPHPVELTFGFWLGDTIVTQALWETVMGTNPSEFKSPNNPVETVNWDDCQEFITRLNGHLQGLDARLPTEAEWEYACRAGTTGATYAGDFRLGSDIASVLDPIAWYSENSNETTHPVAQKQANSWGLYDMLGNVYEWCADWYGDFDKAAAYDPKGPAEGAGRVLRGGSWRGEAINVRAAVRDTATPDRRYSRVGLRLASTPAASPAKRNA